MAFITSLPVTTRLPPAPLRVHQNILRPQQQTPARLPPAKLWHSRQTRMDLADKGIYAPAAHPSSTRVVIFGATGYIGRFVTAEFIRRGYLVTAFAREKSGVGGKKSPDSVRDDFEHANVIVGDVTNPEQVAKAFASAPDDDATPPTSTIVVSCLASRTGGVADSNAIDYEATLNTLREGRNAGATHFILLSAICVQKPELEFQRAKLRFETALQEEATAHPEFSYSIVRPTAFFKSLAAQIERLKKGSAFIMFGDGDLSKCNALSESDLANFMADCASDLEKRNAILPVGGPGSAVTPKEQADILFKLLDRKPKYIKVPIGIMDGAIGALDFVARFVPQIRDAVEFGRIGRYYAVEDMVGPSTGSETLEQFFSKAIKDGGLEGQDLGDAAIF